MRLATMEIDFLKQLIAQRSGNVISSNQDYLLESRLIPVAKSVGLENVHALVAELRKLSESALPERVADAMTINETSFFRDMAPFETLKDVVIPTMTRPETGEYKLAVDLVRSKLQWAGALHDCNDHLRVL